MLKKFKIGKFIISASKPRCFVIAEIGINHMGNFNLCKEMIIAASISGADAVKLQSIDDAYGLSIHDVQDKLKYSRTVLEEAGADFVIDTLDDLPRVVEKIKSM